MSNLGSRGEWPCLIVHQQCAGGSTGEELKAETEWKKNEEAGQRGLL